MKKLTIIYACILYVLIFAMCSCGRERKAFTIISFNHNVEYTNIDCDSVNMISNTKAEYYVNGHKMSVYAEKISVKSNN